MARSTHFSDCGREYPTLDEARERDQLVACYRERFKDARQFTDDDRRNGAAIRAADDHEAVAMMMSVIAFDPSSGPTSEEHKS